MGSLGAPTLIREMQNYRCLFRNPENESEEDFEFEVDVWQQDWVSEDEEVVQSTPPTQPPSHQPQNLQSTSRQSLQPQNLQSTSRQNLQSQNFQSTSRQSHQSQNLQSTSRQSLEPQTALPGSQATSEPNVKQGKDISLEPQRNISNLQIIPPNPLLNIQVVMPSSFSSSSIPVIQIIFQNTQTTDASLQSGNGDVQTISSNFGDLKIEAEEPVMDQVPTQLQVPSTNSKENENKKKGEKFEEEEEVLEMFTSEKCGFKFQVPLLLMYFFVADRDKVTKANTFCLNFFITEIYKCCNLKV